MEVTAFAGDGNSKVMMKVCEGSAQAKRSGRPSQRKTKPKPHLNGWFMITDPSNGRILSVEVMSEPENNAVKIAAIKKILHIYPNVDLFIHDVNCKLAPSI